MSLLKTGVIQNITLKDTDINEVYSIDVFLGDSSGILRRAYPLDTNIKRVPLLGEIVLIFSSIGLGTNRQDRDSRLYYMNPLAIQLNTNNNAFPQVIAPVRKPSNNQNYEDTSQGNANVGNIDDEDTDLGEGFEVNDSVNPLQPFLGDVLIEGRFGHSLRFGYTPQTSQTSKTPSWAISRQQNRKDPLTILSNGRGETNEYNKFVIEDVNDDLSSMWMTSTQRVRLSTSQRNIGSGVDNQSEFDEPTIILNSNRLVLNSKSERIILSAAETVNVATPNWAMDLDSLFTEIKNLVDGVIDLNENLEKAHEQISKAHQQIASLSTELASLKVTTAAGPGVVSPDQIPKFLASKGISEVNKRNTDSNKVDSTSIKQTIQSILQTISRMEQ